MSKVIPSISLAVLLAAGCLGSVSAVAAEAPVEKKTLVQVLQQPINFASAEMIYNRAVKSNGDARSLTHDLSALANNATQSKGVRAKALYTLSFIQWREGQMGEALKSVNRGLTLLVNADLTLQKAKLLDATGNFTEALTWYKKSIPMLVGSDLEQVQVRVTLMETNSNVASLVKLAKSKGNGFRNRAAVTLAILGHESEAIELYKVDADAKQADRFRQRIRLADWSIRANNPARAQQEAWDAVRLAKLSRNRRYALSLLVEAHRMNDSIDELIAKMEGQKTLAEDQRTVWVELLRETGQYQRAIAAFKETSENWTPNLKRQLIGLYKEANSDQALEREFAGLIKAEPSEVSWAQGLAEHFLERGRRADAIDVWRDFTARNERYRDLLAGAGAMMQLGLDTQAVAAAEKIQKIPDRYSDGGFFLFELYLARGQLEKAEQMLSMLDKTLPADSLQRRDLADGFERIQQPEKALQALKGLYDNGVELGVDGEMRIAWLQQSLGKKQQALDSWYTMLEKTPKSQRRLVEDRILMLSAELGQLGKAAVALEKKVLNKTASEDDARMLIKIYTKAGDAGAAVEIIEEYFGDGSSRNDLSQETVASLREKSNIFMLVGDHNAYDKIVRQLMTVDTGNELTHLRSLILNLIENADVNQLTGTEDELQQLIDQHNGIADGDSAREFEASVMELAGDRQQALQAYRQALAENPDRGDNYLIMANMMVQLWQTDKAVRLFQYLAERADDENLFVIAMDGLLNMRAEDSSVDPNVIRWAQRITLERLTGNADKAYLYSVLADLADEGGDVDMQLAALENSLSHANSRRAVTLRELIVLTDPSATGFGGTRPARPDIRENLKYSRRLIAMRQEFPPEVYINMGKAFLMANEPDNALVAFNMAVDATGRSGLMIEAASQFEAKNFDRQAMSQYERAQVTNNGDLRILWRLGELKERAGFGDAAHQLYSEGILGILSRHPIQWEESNVRTNTLIGSMVEIPGYVRQDQSKSDEYKRNLFPLRDGFIRTLPKDSSGLQQKLAEFWRVFTSDLNRAAADNAHRILVHYPRLNVVSQFLRYVGLSTGDYKLADRVDRELLTNFPQDKALVRGIVAVRHAWGQVAYGQDIADFRLPAETRNNLQKNWSELVASNSRPVVTPDRTAGQGELGQRYKLALRVGDQDKLLELCREMIKSGAFAEALQKGQRDLSNGHFKRLCSYTAQRLNNNKKAFEAALKGRNDSWRTVVEAQNGQSIFTEDELLNRLSGYDDLNRFDSGYILSRLTGRNRERFLKALEPTISKHRGMLSGVIATQLGKPLSDSEKNLWLELADEHARAFDKQDRVYVRRFIDSAEVAPENVKFFYDLVQIMLPDTDKSGDVTALNLKVDVISGRYEKAMDTVIDLVLNEKVTTAAQGTPNRSRSNNQQGISREANRFFSERFNDLFQGRRELAMAALEKSERRGGDADKLLLLRINLLQKYLAGNPRDLVAELEMLSAQRPGNRLLLNSLGAQYQQLGDTHKYIAILQKLMESSPQNRQHQHQLQRIWRHLDHPINVLATGGNFTRRQSSRRTTPANSASTPGANQLEHYNDPAKMQAMVRKLWQQTAVGENKVDRPAGVAALELEALLSMKWPQGSGLDEASTEGAMVIEKIADYPFSVAEYETWVASLRCDQVPRAWPIFKALAVAHQKHGSIKSRAKQLQAEAKAGRAGNKEMALWLTLLMADASLVDGSTLNVLRQAAGESAEGILQEPQLRAAADIFARAGAMADSLASYRALAIAAVRVERGAGFDKAKAMALLNDAKQKLDAPHYYDLLASVLEFTYLLGNDNLESYYGSFVVAALQQELDSVNIKERFGDLAARHIKVTPSWRATDAMDAAYVQVRMGMGQQGLDSLRLALASNTTSSRVGINEAINTDYKPSVFIKLAPAANGVWLGSGQWINAVADKLPAWLVDPALDVNQVLELAGVLMKSLSSHGEVAKSQQISRLVGEVLAGDGLLSEMVISQVLASAESAGTPIDLAISQQLLKGGRLHISQIIAVLQRTLTEQGASQALALGKPMTEYSLNSDLLMVLTRAAKQVGKSDEARAFEEMQQRAEAARQKMGVASSVRQRQI